MKKFVIVLIIILTVVALGVGGYFLWNHFNQSEDANSNETQTTTNENKQTKENEKNKKSTKIIGTREFETDVLGKFNCQIEASFDEGKLMVYKVNFNNIKDEYALKALKAQYATADIEDKITFGEGSFGYELTGDEYTKSINTNKIVTRNYIYSMLKTAGFTITVEGDDSFLTDNTESSENNTESNNETTTSNENADASVTGKTSTTSVNVNLDDIINKAKEYANSEEFKNAKQQATEYVQNNADKIEEAAKKAQEQANEYIKNNQDQIDAAKKKAEQMMKQYGF